MTNWMKALAHHYERTRERYPRDTLLLMFDIDGTIVDSRYMILHVLNEYDQRNGTKLFQQLEASDIRVSEGRIGLLLQELGIDDARAWHVLDWWNERRWSANVLLEAHRPYSGVMEVMRWFQLQPGVEVAINTGRPESVRQETMRVLNELGKEYKVRFTDDLVHMNSDGWDAGVEQSKVEALRRFRNSGRRVFAFVDNEPSNLVAVSKADPDQEVLLLHANTVFESKGTRLPVHSVKGTVYDLTNLASEEHLPGHIQFVWHGVNDKANLRQFLASNVQWCEIDVRLASKSGQLILSHDPLRRRRQDDMSRLLAFEEVFDKVVASGKSIKIDIKENSATFEAVLAAVQEAEMDHSRLWFNGKIETLGEAAIRKLSRAFPSSVVQCPVDFLVPLISTSPTKALDVLVMMKDWGVNRVSVTWETANDGISFHLLDKWGFDVNIYNVPGLESFLRAILLEPRSITSDFNFPKWQYYGRGSGEAGSFHEYSIRRDRQDV